MNMTIAGQYLNLTLSEQGLQQIVLNSKHSILATNNGLYLNNPPSPLTHSLIGGNAKDVQITHIYNGITAYYNYSIYNNDITIQIKLTNGTNQPFVNPAFTFPTFNFSRNASGNMHSWHPTYLAYCGLSIYHPGLFTPLAASYANDDTFGICLHSPSHLLAQTLVNANWVTDGIIPAQCTPNIYIIDTVPPQASINIVIILRVTDSITLPNLVGAYIADYKKIVGPLQYTPNDRPIIGSWPEDQTWVSSDSPLGLHSARRIDTPEGITAMQTMLTPSIGLSQGTIFWQPQGWNPRGAQYRPDFDCWPPTIQQNLPTLINWFKANGISFGLCARAAQLISPATYTADGVYDIDYRNQSQLDMLWQRFQNVITQGVNLFYFDTFGIDTNSYNIMKFLRPKLGPTISVYTEYTSDILLPYSGVYTELMDNDGDTRWYSRDTMTIFRLLQPTSSIITASELPADPTTNLAGTSADIYGKLKLTPIIPDFLSSAAKPLLQSLVNTYISDNVWK